MSFDPDTSQGNSGIQGHGEIVDGAYETLTGQGVNGGPMNVWIVGYDGVVPDGIDAAMQPHGNQVFSQQLSIDLPRANGTHDFQLVDESPQE